MMFSKIDILSSLDSCGHENPYRFFPDLEHGYFHTMGSRINLFADENRWAIVFEITGYSNKNFQVEIQLFCFGNCLINQDRAGLNNQYISNLKIFPIIDAENLDEIQDKNFDILSDAQYVIVRDTLLPIELDINRYKEKKIYNMNFHMPNSKVDVVALLRYLDDVNPEIFRATQKELRICLPEDIPFLMKIDKWHHKQWDFYTLSHKGPKPSSYETFQMIADILVAKDTSLWKPTLKPNNDWRNYPNAGNL